MKSLPGFSRGGTSPLSLENMQPVFAVGQQPPIPFPLKHLNILHILHFQKRIYRPFLDLVLLRSILRDIINIEKNIFL